MHVGFQASNTMTNMQFLCKHLTCVQLMGVIMYAFGLFCKSNLRVTNVSNMISLLNNKPSEESLVCLLGRRYKSYLGVSPT